ncbi:MAG: hypothetical protein KatS3mg032_2228 [Cyclobacteriaceae bacterium]|nr:MAG: hypothetical protein KatS3mg032_2228 [Cyclobacteriaceae bacterium]
MNRIGQFLLFTLLLPHALLAQGERKDKTAVTYEEIYDEPYSVNKLFVHLQPFYGELFATNVNAGFGMEAQYYLQDKVDFKAHFRKTYSQKFYDFTRDLAAKTSDTDNDIQIFNYYEFGLNWHVRDFDESSKTKMFLYRNSYKGNKWAARVPLTAEIPCKVRKIYGARLGGMIWDSGVHLNRVMEEQGISYSDFKSGDGIALSDFTTTADLFTNISSKSLYLGGSMTWIRNVAVQFDKFEPGVDDLILTTYFDILFAPSLKIDNIVYTPRDPNSGAPLLTEQRAYSTSPVDLKSFGFRAGIEGKFNRQFSWAYGGEIGYRPGVQGKTFYALIKISIPVFGTSLDYSVEAFGK